MSKNQRFRTFQFTKKPNPVFRLEWRFRPSGRDKIEFQFAVPKYARTQLRSAFAVGSPVSGGVNKIATKNGSSTREVHFSEKNRRSATNGIASGDLVLALPARRAYLGCVNRIDGRAFDQIRPVSFELGIAPYASASVLVAMGNTRVICGVMVEEGVPRWMKEQGVSGGWLTAEYSMLPYSTESRKPRDIAKGKLDGRSSEIQRLIGRSLRAVVDLERLGARTIWVDCDVLQADGGTRTAAITGASLAVALACQKLAEEKRLAAPPVRKLIAAISAGVLDGTSVVDLNYAEDKAVTVDFNMVVTEDGEFVELQGSGEEATFSQEQLAEMLRLGKKSVSELIEAQRAVLAGLADSESKLFADLPPLG